MKKYYFEAKHRYEWGDDYETIELVISAKNIDKAMDKVEKLYKDTFQGKWEGSLKQLIFLKKIED